LNYFRYLTSAEPACLC